MLCLGLPRDDTSIGLLGVVSLVSGADILHCGAVFLYLPLITLTTLFSGGI